LLGELVALLWLCGQNEMSSLPYQLSCFRQLSFSFQSEALKKVYEFITIELIKRISTNSDNGGMFSGSEYGTFFPELLKPINNPE
jgi:hypothetical protein